MAMSSLLDETSTGPCACADALVLPDGNPEDAGAGAGLLCAGVMGLRSVRGAVCASYGYSICTVLLLASRCCLLKSAVSSPPTLAEGPCLGMNVEALLDASTAGLLVLGSLTDALRPSCGSSSFIIAA